MSTERKLLEAAKPVNVGDGATQHLWSDSHAYTVIEVRSKFQLVLQKDIARRVDKNGMSDQQEYEYERDPQGHTLKVSLRRNGRWYEVGSPGGQGSTSYGIGYRREYHDYSF